MAQAPKPVAAGESPGAPDTEPVIGSVTILVYGWDPGRSVISLQFPTEALPGQPDAVSQQAKFKARLLADLDDAFNELGGS